MKKMIVILLLVGLTSYLVGCTNIPVGVKSALYSSQISLETMVDDVEAGNPPFGDVPNETPAETIERQQEQIQILKDMMKQANLNLKAVVEYFRTGENK